MATHQQVFQHYCSKDGKVDVKMIPKLLRCCGVNPSSEEIKLISRKLGGKKSIDFQEFQNILSNPELKLEVGSKDVCIKALKNVSQLRGLDPEYISVVNLKSALTEIGKDTLSPKEFDEIMKQIEDLSILRDVDGNINVEDFVERVLLLF